jgi:predicted esterase
MVLIECKCGKRLKVKEELVGKSIKCPACATVQRVRMPGPSLKAAESPPAAKLSEETRISARTKRRARRDDGEDTRARKKTARGSKISLLRMGAGAAALLVLGSVAVWLWVLRDNNGIADKSASAPKAQNKASSEPSKSGQDVQDVIAARPYDGPAPPFVLAVPTAMTKKIGERDLTSLTPDQLAHLAFDAAGKGDYDRAAQIQFWYVQKTRDGYYNLACYCARLGQKDAALYWLQMAAVEEGIDTAHAARDEDLVILHTDPRWPVVQKFFFATNEYFAKSGSPSTVLVLPMEYDGTTPLTVVAYLHGLGSRPDDFVGHHCQGLANMLKIAFVGVSGTIPRGPRSFVWSEDPARDAQRVDDALAEIADRVKIKPGHVITMGFSQGAQMGLEIAVRNPEKFAGAIVMSPGAKSSLNQVTPSPLLAKRGFMLMCGQKEQPGNLKLTSDAADWLESAHSKVQDLRYIGVSTHGFPPHLESHFGEWTKFIEDAQK